MRPTERSPLRTSNSDGISDGQSSSSHRFTFTPRRVKAPPRAWERRPATPFAARNDAQKIWKRVPLQNVTERLNGAWRRGGDRDDGIMRPVKRLRTGNVTICEDKENVAYAGVKYDPDVVSAASPTRRRKAPMTVMEVFEPVNIAEDPSSCGRSMPEAGAETVPGTTAVAPAEADSGKSHSGQELIPKLTTNIPDRQRGLEPAPQKVVPEAVENPLSRSPSPQSRHDKTQSDHNGVSSLHPRSGIPDAATDHEIALEGSTKATHALDARSEQEETGNDITASSSPPPTNPQELGLASSSAFHSGAPVETSNVVSQFQPMGSGLDVGSSITDSNANLLADHDDAAFLHEFLTRTRAQKAARLQPDSQIQTNTIPSNPCSQSGSSVKTDVENSPPRATDQTSPSAMPDCSENGTVSLETEVEREANMASPRRRSSRLTMRVPRRHRLSTTTLPSSISLKRLNGTEFISMQRESQSLALATRANTKKNKGDAVPVQIKLVQLHAEACAREGSDVPEEDRTKKKNGKEVSWDETLERYQDRDGPTDEPAVESQVMALLPPEIQLATDGQAQKSQTRKVKKLRKLNAGTVNGTPAPKRSIPIPVSTVDILADEYLRAGRLLRPRRKA